PGIIQYAIAALHPKHLAAITPGGTINRIYADGWYMGGVYYAAFAAHWSQFDQPGASKLFAVQRVQAGDDQCKAAAEKIGPNNLVPSLEAQRYDGDYYQQVSPYNRAPEVTVPTLMVQSWTDPAVGSSALWVFDRLKAKDKRLFVLSGDHGAYHYSTAQDEVMRWMDRWVRGEKNGVEKLPRVRVDFQTTLANAPGFGEIGQASVGWTQSLRDWPPPDTQWRTWHLTADGRLADEAASGKQAGARAYFYPTGTELTADNTQFAVQAQEWAALRYRSEPVKQDTGILGAPQLVFYASSTQADTDFRVTLHDISPEGDVTYLQHGMLRASRRAVDAARSNAQYVFHPHERDEPLMPGQVYEFRLSLFPLAHVLRAGHALELLVSAPPQAAGFTPLMLPGFNTLLHDAAHDSRLLVPYVPGLKAQAPMPACGALPFQPCRRAALEKK
ncbi:MAG TPA: CocE/NonD family hydrolase, partial [Nevskiaceae bacterium]|nr:CocE/NonD family hydrolase [Nevskiaceae bacterium]